MDGVFTVNGKKCRFVFKAAERLLFTLRNHGFSEVKNGCLEGECGACVVLLDDKPVNSCQVFTASALGKDIKTVKGIGTFHEPHIIQEAFVDAGAVQCGFCTPGLVLVSYALLKENPNPSEAEIKDALDGNLCRCTGYVKIIEAVKLAAKRMKNGELEIVD
ncbi:MAG: (2Fe-2S)-binding protein [Candidatus Marinimicrobia bacterium]|nr:(2Fe-2S)-binding protein [Candidatus Neomarinimicrobiota bacterium]